MIKGVGVVSVVDGVVLLSGKTDSLAATLRAIESAHSVGGVRRIVSQIDTVER